MFYFDLGLGLGLDKSDEDKEKTVRNIVTFYVKPYESETDLKAIGECIKGNVYFHDVVTYEPALIV